MNLTETEALARLAANDHGILCTLHAVRGVDAVPVVYATDNEGFVGVPVDRIKPKASLRLQRERNLEADPRATLLVEHWNRDDWSQLCWVRTELRWEGRQVSAREDALADELVRLYSQRRPCSPGRSWSDWDYKNGSSSLARMPARNVRARAASEQ